MTVNAPQKQCSTGPLKPPTHHRSSGGSIPSAPCICLIWYSLFTHIHTGEEFQENPSMIQWTYTYKFSHQLSRQTSVIPLGSASPANPKKRSGISSVETELSSCKHHFYKERKGAPKEQGPCARWSITSTMESSRRNISSKFLDSIKHLPDYRIDS